MAGTVLPQQLLQSLQRVEGFDEGAFVNVHEQGPQVVSIRLNPSKIPTVHERPFSDCEPVPWSRLGYYLPSRPSFTFDPLFHAGAYYVQEASSMFIEQCLSQFTDLTRPLAVLDLCAAPGGKSTHVQSLISTDSLLVSNEVTKSRAGVLTENMTKWGGVNTAVTNNDPRDFARLQHYFDVVIVDAPCSGSGLFRRDASTVQEWSTGAVEMCSRRQQRILTDVYPALKQGGILIYSTCSYSVEEDEDICDWLCKKFDLTPLHINVKDWKIIETGNNSKVHGYRFFPDKIKGEGFFLSCFRKNDGQHRHSTRSKKSRLTKLSSSETKIVSGWLQEPAAMNLYQVDREIFAFPGMIEAGLLDINANLYTRKAGVCAGKIMNSDLIPAHELALSSAVSGQLLTISLKKEEALQYLRREDVNLRPDQKGWALVRFGDLNLGWVKLLPNRVNNYYPKEWRILKSG